MKKLRVLAAMVLPPHMTVSGAARAGERLSFELAQLDGVEVHIANMAGEVGRHEPPNGSTEPARLAVRVRNPLGWAKFLPNRIRTPLNISDMPRRIKRGSFDLVHIHNTTPSIEMWRVAKASRRAGIPYVVSTHGFVEIADGERIYEIGRAGRLAWRLLVTKPVTSVVRHAARIFMLSPADIDAVERLGGVGVAKCIVSNGVDLPDPASRQERPTFLGDTDDPKALRAFFLANHTPNKGIDVLLEAFAAIEEPYVLVVGGDKRQFVDYDSFIERCRPGQRIIIPGRLSDEDVGALFEWADAFVFPTLADTLPLVVLEAMAHGVPVVSTTVGGIPYELEGGCGVLVPAGDAAALAAALRSLALDPDACREMGKRARLRAETEFAWSAAAADALAAYRELAGRAPEALPASP